MDKEDNCGRSGRLSREGSAEPVPGGGWWAGPAPWPVWAVLAAVLCAPVVNMARADAGGGMDNAIVVRAARVWSEGGSPYADPHFLYLPGAVLAAVPQVFLPRDVLGVLVPAAVTGMLVAAWWCALRLHGVGARSRFAVLGAVGLALAFAPFGHLVRLGNWTVTAALALPVALLLMSRGRWTAAGAVLGTAVALKPLLLPVALLFVFARRPRGLVAMAGVAAALSGGAALLMPDPGGFFTATLPFLLAGDDAFVRLYEASVPALLTRLGVPGAVAGAVGFAVAGCGVWCAYRRWRGEGQEGERGRGLRLAETGGLLMLSAFLVSRPSYDHYLLVVLPLLLAGAAVPGAAARGVWFWVALVPQVPGFVWPYLEVPTRRAFKDAATLCGLAASVGAAAVRRGGRARRRRSGAVFPARVRERSAVGEGAVPPGGRR